MSPQCGRSLRIGALVLLLAGCAATSPQKVREMGARSEFKSSKAPRDTATCIARNGAEFRQGVSSVLDGPSPDTYEVLVHLPGIGNNALISDVAPSGSGSSVVMWLAPHAAAGYPKMPQIVMKGCE